MAAPDLFLGLDIGSRTTKIAELAAGAVVGFEVFDTTHDSIGRVRARLDRRDYARAAATGYGRYLMNAHLDCRVVTEITACALGTRFLRPEAGLVIDIGGQDSKVILLGNGSGAFADFEMNDRCAAGTGRFLEVMARLLGFGIEEFGRAACDADEMITVSSMCTVFAESEVISLLAAGRDRASIALGLHGSIADRVYPLAARFDAKGEIVMAGGVALNPCLVDLLSKRLGRPIVVPEHPQIVTAVGAALAAAYEGVKP
ncbi:MAG: acyl-CoA dehydratase activase [Candidatus Aminicenantales bacterium]